MTFAEGMVAALEADAGLGAVLGGTGDAMRLYPLVLPESPTLPAVVYQRVSAPRSYVLNAGDVPYMRARYQYAVWADDYLEAEQTTDVLIAKLEGFRATLSSGERVDVVKIENDLDTFEPDTGRSRRLVDAVWHYEPS